MATGTWEANGWRLLWENPNPNSDFPGQTLSINTSGYERLKIDFNLNTASAAGNEIYFTSEVGLYFNRALFFCFYGGKYVQRTTNPGWRTATTLTFGAGQISNTYGAVPTTANNYLIPVRIYAK